MNNNSKFCLYIKPKIEAIMRICASKKGADSFYKLIGSAVILYVFFEGVIGLLLALPKSGLL